MKLHAIVSELRVARSAIEGGATVIQLRLKNLPTETIVERGRPFRALCTDRAVAFVVNDDIDAARALGADGVHLGQADVAAHGVRASELVLGISAATVEEALAAEQLGAAYVGAGPVWATPSKPDADSPIGLEGLAMICDSVSVPVVAIGGIDISNAADCIESGAAGVAVIRAAGQARELRAVIDRAAG
ncbi:MAG: thiamine phosphate synthase [Actinomycetota bacterium]|nr:thiamine phosphate synthase [Actinomycetota bacterium]